MSDELSIEERIKELNYQERILEVIKDAVMNNITNPDVLREDYGLTENEIEWFFSEVVKEKFYTTPSQILPLVEKKMTEIRKKLKKLRGEALRDLKAIIFPNWRKLISARFPGLYYGKMIRAISRNSIILIGYKENYWQDIYGNENAAIFGLGFFYCEFVPATSNTVLNHFEVIHGILMPKAILDKAKNSAPVIRGRFSENYREFYGLIKLDYYNEPATSRRFLEGLYARIAREYKTLISKAAELIRDDSIVPKDLDSLVLLSALPESFNKLLVTSNKIEELEEKVERGIPGLMGYDPSLEKMNDFLRNIKVEHIIDEINHIRTTFLKYGWDVLSSLVGGAF